MRMPWSGGHLLWGSRAPGREDDKQREQETAPGAWGRPSDTVRSILSMVDLPSDTVRSILFMVDLGTVC